MSTILCNHVTILQMLAKVRKQISAVVSTGAPIHLRKHPEFRTAFSGKGGQNVRGPEPVEGPREHALPALSAEGGPELLRNQAVHPTAEAS